MAVTNTQHDAAALRAFETQRQENPAADCVDSECIFEAIDFFGLDPENDEIGVERIAERLWAEHLRIAA